MIIVIGNHHSYIYIYNIDILNIYTVVDSYKNTTNTKKHINTISYILKS